MDDKALDRLGAGKYLLITSYRKNGTGVATPVWVVRDGDALGAWSAADSWKVKRIRARGDVMVGPCDVRGNPTGEQIPATAEINWETYNNFRSGDLTAGNGTTAPDLTVARAGVCEVDCDEVEPLIGHPYNVFDFLVSVSTTIGRAMTVGNKFILTTSLLGLEEDVPRG